MGKTDDDANTVNAVEVGDDSSKERIITDTERRLREAVEIKNKRKNDYNFMDNYGLENLEAFDDCLIYSDINGNQLKLSYNLSESNIKTMVQYIKKRTYTKDITGIDLDQIIKDEPLNYSTKRVPVGSINDTPFMRFVPVEAFLYYSTFLFQMVALGVLGSDPNKIQPVTTFGLFVVRVFIACYLSIQVPKEMNLMIKRKFFTLDRSYAGHLIALSRYGMFLIESIVMFVRSALVKDWKHFYATQVPILDFILRVMTFSTSLQLILRQGTIITSLFNFTGLLLVDTLDDFFGRMIRIDYMVSYSLST